MEVSVVSEEGLVLLGGGRHFIRAPRLPREDLAAEIWGERTDDSEWTDNNGSSSRTWYEVEQQWELPECW